jgi:hypothetical protein
MKTNLFFPEYDSITDSNIASTISTSNSSLVLGTTSSNVLTFSDTSTNINNITLTNNLISHNIIMQNKVAIFKVTRDEDNKIIKTEFIKELWVETKTGVSVDFQVARDKDLEKYDASELVIKTISTVIF